MASATFSCTRWTTPALGPTRRVDLPAVREVLGQVLVELAGQLGIEDTRSHSSSWRSDRLLTFADPTLAMPSVDRHDLGVEHRAFVAVDADTGVEQVLVGQLADDLWQPLVGVVTGHEDHHVDATLGRRTQLLGESGVGGEVGRGDVDVPLGEVEQRVLEHRDVAPAVLGLAADDLDDLRAVLGLFGEPVALVGDAASRRPRASRRRTRPAYRPQPVRGSGSASRATRSRPGRPPPTPRRSRPRR